MSNRRAQAIHDRKQRIIAAAREIIAIRGYDALTTRGLAEAAGVTAPTLYNLVGDKKAIVSAMAVGSIEELWDRLQFDRRATPLEMADAIIDEAYALIQEEPRYHKAAFVALERLGIAFAYHPDRDDPGAHTARRSVEMAEFACRAAQQQGMLRGNLSPRDLGVQMFAAYRAALDDWLHDAIDDGELLRRQRYGFYAILAADAAEPFREVLLARMSKLTNSNAAQEAA